MRNDENMLKINVKSFNWKKSSLTELWKIENFYDTLSPLPDVWEEII